MDEITVAHNAGLIGGISVEEAQRMGLLKDDFKGEPLETDEQEDADG